MDFRGGEVAKLTWATFELALATAQKFRTDDAMFNTCFEVGVVKDVNVVIFLTGPYHFFSRFISCSKYSFCEEMLK